MIKYFLKKGEKYEKKKVILSLRIFFLETLSDIGIETRYLCFILPCEKWFIENLGNSEDEAK